MSGLSSFVPPTRSQPVLHTRMRPRDLTRTRGRHPLLIQNISVLVDYIFIFHFNE